MEAFIYYTILLVLFISWFRWRWKKTSLFQELGIPGPKPNFFFGNMLELYRKGPLECEKIWFEKYGKVVGYYYGMQPVLMVADLDLVKKIFVKDFHLFSDRPAFFPLRARGVLEYILPFSPILNNLLVNLKGQRWKEVRSILTPTFSSAKMKLMVPLVNEALDETLSKISEKASSSESFEIYDVFRKLTLDVICRTAFAVKLNVQEDSDNIFLQLAKTMMSMEYKSMLMFFGMSFPEFQTFVTLLHLAKLLWKTSGVIPSMEVTKMIRNVIKERRQSSECPLDLLQLMIEASVSEEADDEDEKKSGALKSDDAALINKKKLQLTDMEIQANALVVFVAGYETTSTALAYVFHLLVKYPEYQDKIREEIDELLASEDELNYSTVSKLKLLDRFFLETMRIYPPVIKFVSRAATTDVVYGDVHIKKGVEIQLPVYYIHHNPEHWADPEVFNPDRFLPENKGQDFNLTYAPFGIGPRNCIGFRFATIEAKLTIAKLLQRFVFVPSRKEQELELEIKLKTLVPKNVFVKAYERN